MLLCALLATGCKTSQSQNRDRHMNGYTVLSDVMLDGVSLVGAWYAVEVEGDRLTTRDLEDGTLETTLIVEPNGRAVLTGIDRREGDGPVTFVGLIRGNRITFREMDGAGTLYFSGRRLVLRDPNGRRTVYVRNMGR